MTDSQQRGRPEGTNQAKNPTPGLPGALLSLLLSLILVPLPLLGANALLGNASPYLAMHGQDPVNWREWGPAAIEEARAADKPLFLSSGYFACHWCHVMQRESYRNPEIAALLNRHFVPVKLDRELHPALDDYLIGFVERVAGHAGWPLNVFITPSGYPLVGLTYAPPGDFESLLKRVSGAWAREREALEGLARRAARERSAEQAASGPSPGHQPLPPERIAQRLKRQALAFGDEIAGGFGRQTRFPMAPNIAALLALQARDPDPALADFLRTTLDAMKDLGLRDHLGGGFFRYTVDPDWNTPHFEKMLYNQALLAPLFLLAAEVLDRPEYRAVARDTLDFMVREMRGTNGGFIASFSAVDDQGMEGGAYLWRPVELEQLLEPDQRRLLALVWRLEGPSMHAAGLLPMQALSLDEAAGELGITVDRARRIMDGARARLLAARAQRSLPKDGKQLAGWNGLALSALVAGAQAFGEDSYRGVARELRDYLVHHLWDGKALHRAASARGWIGEPTLEDYAFVSRGLLDWGRLSGSREDLALARRLAALAWERFRSEGGWRLSENPLLPGVPAEPALSDSPLPSPAATLMGLGLTGDDPTLARRAQRVLMEGSSPVETNPFTFSSHALLMIEHPSGQL